MSSNDTDKATYAVVAKRWKRGWELHIDGVGVTQSRTLNDAEGMVRDYIALDTGADPCSFGIVITPEVDAKLDAETRQARRAVAAADSAVRDAATASRKVVTALKTAGLSGREIAVVLGISPQRVSQILRSGDAGLRGARGRIALRAAEGRKVSALPMQKKGDPLPMQKKRDHSLAASADKHMAPRGSKAQGAPSRPSKLS